MSKELQKGDVEVHDTHHVIELSVYYKVFAALMVLFVLTVAVAFVDFAELIGPRWGWLNILIAMIIAVVKAAIIMMYFMHVKFSSRTTQVFAAAALVWLMILFFGTLTDYFSRPWLPDPAVWSLSDGGG